MSTPTLPRALAADATARVAIDDAGIIHVDVGPLSLRLEHEICAALTTVLARAMVRLARERRRPRLTLVDSDEATR
ncbi:MAG: hypothetical protein R3A79_24385 [Nannocystaceae bacterium]